MKNKLGPGTAGRKSAHPNKVQKKKSAEEIQNEIFRMMPPAKKLKLASDYSMFILRTRKVADPTYGISRTNRKNSKRI